MIVDMPQLNGDEKIGDLIEHVARLQKLVQFLLNGKISSDNIKARSIETESITAGAITANEITVEELSAITANMGKLTSGEIYGAYIATSEGTFPRAEMSSTSNLFGLLTSLTNYIKVMAFDSFAGAPQMEFANGSRRLLVYATPTFINFQVAGGDLSLTSSGDTYLNAWSKIINSSTLQSLQAALDSKATKSVATGSTTVAVHNHGFTSSDYIQCYDSSGVATVKKQFSPYSGDTHSHTQN